MRKLLSTTAFAAIVGSTALVPLAFAWDGKIGGFVGQTFERHVKPPAQQTVKAVENTAKAVIAPATAAVDVLIGKKSVPDAATDVMHAQGGMISATAQATAAAANGVTGIVIDTARDTTSALGGNGDSAAAVVGTIQAPSSLMVNGAASLVDGVGQAIQNDPSYIVSSQLAAAIRDARTRLAPQARPLPADVKAKLRAVHSEDTLSRARYVVADIPSNLAALIDHAQRIRYPKGFAVAVDDIIVFSRMPDASGDLQWWAHEVEHTVQYREMGIERFANAYLKNRPAVERQAEMKEDAMGQVLADASGK